jgi:hypothetical protein
MRKVRTAFAAVLAVATLSLGGAACTPEQQAQLGTGIGQVIGLAVYLSFMQAYCAGVTTHDCGP